MDISQFSLEELMLTAIKSETQAFKIYHGLAKQVENGVLKGHLNFLAAEEKKHEGYLTDTYKVLFPEKAIKLPDRTTVPLPEIHIEHEMVNLSEILEQAMKAELAANEFYRDLSARFDDNQDIKKMLLKFSEMEMKHYEILKKEQESVKKTEDAYIDWDMIHLGP